jgi:hypothetical protein
MTGAARPVVRRKKFLTTTQVRQIARDHSISEKDGSRKTIHPFDIELAIRDALELAGVKVKEEKGPLEKLVSLSLMAI